MAEQIAMLSLPNMGTDWLASMVLVQNPTLRYFREFFNPITNLNHADALGNAFGCEMVSNYHHIAEPTAPCERAYRRTWLKEKYNFTKENYSPFQVEFFSKHFQCFVLLRKTELVFPPGRPEVMAWYDAIYNSLVVNKQALDQDTRGRVEYAIQAAKTLNEKTVAACEICSRKLLLDAQRFGLPVFDYDKLMDYSQEELVGYVESMPGVIDSAKMAEEIVKTRRKKKSSFQKMSASHLLAALRVKISLI
jgi:hypothetical protein